MADWLSRTVPDFSPLSTSARVAVPPAAASYGEDVIRTPGNAPGSFEGLEYWTTEVAFDVGRDLEGIKYLYTAGQSMHDGNREPRKGQVTSEWFGGGWEERANAFLQAVEFTDAEGQLSLPRPWGVITARVRNAHVVGDPTMGGCTITFDWEEVGHENPMYFDDRAPTTSEVLAGIPDGDDADDLREAAEAYLGGVESTDTTADDLLLLILELRTMAAIYEAGVDTTTEAGCIALDGVALAVAGAVRLFPNRTLLESAWV